MKVLLVITNINGDHEIPYSIGLSSIASYIESRGHEQKIVDVREQEQYGRFLDQVEEYGPDLVGFTSVSSQFSSVKKLAEMVKNRHPEMKVVCGGVHTTIFPESVAECPSLDCVFVGESEYAFADYLDTLEGGGDWRELNNIAYVKGGNVIINKLNPLIQDIGSLPYPDKGYLFEEAIRVEGTAVFFFSRGCPFQCTYCSNHALAKRYDMKMNKPRFREVDSCIDEILQARRDHDFDRLIIGDDTFGLDKGWRLDFLEKYKHKIDIPFQCLLRANVVEEGFIRQLKGAGCFRISFGVESGNDFIRNEVMKRNLSEKQIVDAFALCRKYGIETVALNIIGVPGETEEMIWDTVRLNRKIRPTLSGVNIFYPYKGTHLGDYCFANELVDEELYNDFSNERRDSVLRFDEGFKTRLRYFHSNWSYLVNPWNVKKRVYDYIYRHQTVHHIARFIKRTAQDVFGN